MTVMLALIILRLIEVQADDSPSTPVSHLFKIEDMNKTFSACLEAKFEICKIMAREQNMEVRSSFLFNSIKSCNKIEHPHDPMCQKATDATKYGGGYARTWRVFI